MEENFIVHDDYIELRNPISGIKMITKNPKSRILGTEYNFDPNEKRIGGYTDWCLPTIGNCKTIFEIAKENAHLFNFDCGQIETDMPGIIFDVFKGEQSSLQACWPRDLCFVRLVLE